MKWNPFKPCSADLACAQSTVLFAEGFGTQGGVAQIVSTAMDSNRNVYPAGQFSATTPQLGSIALTKIGTNDGFIAKLDAKGAV